jgi:hypothetical protein
MGLAKEKKIKSASANVSVFPISCFSNPPGIFLELGF